MVCSKCQIGSRRLVSLLEILQVYVERYAQALSYLQSSANRVRQLGEDFWEEHDLTVGLLQWLILIKGICERDDFPVTGVAVSELKGVFEIALDDSFTLT